MRLPRPLDAVETRVLGALLEKELLTPDAYPMTLPALLAACNQRTSREPVTDLAAAEVVGALDRLREFVLVWKVTGGRAEKWEHNLEAKWQAGRPEKAMLALLLLRGAQTAAELRARAERMHELASVEAAEELLGAMAAHAEPLVAELPRRPGQKEARWTHLVSGPPPAEASSPRSAAPPRVSPMEERLLALEERVAALEAELAALRGSLGG
ncbi:MAG: YceH family protein [Thermoanaerobaculia bacterium]